MTDIQALYAAVLQFPEEDTPRLILADALEDTDPERAEYIRIQCKLWAIYGQEYRGFAMMGENLNLHLREIALFERNVLRWRMPNWMLDASLLRSFGYTNSIRSPKTEVVHTIFHRGFPAIVLCPSQFNIIAIISAQGVGNPDKHVPTGWLKAVVTHHPLEQVVPLDIAPWTAPQDDIHTFQWWEEILGFVDEDDGTIIKPLFQIMWDEWKKSRVEDEDRRWLKWDVRQDAIDALGEAIVTFGKTH